MNVNDWADGRNPESSLTGKKYGYSKEDFMFGQEVRDYTPGEAEDSHFEGNGGRAIWVGRDRTIVHAS